MGDELDAERRCRAKLGEQLGQRDSELVAIRLDKASLETRLADVTSAKERAEAELKRIQEAARRYGASLLDMGQGGTAESRSE